MRSGRWSEGSRREGIGVSRASGGSGSGLAGVSSIALRPQLSELRPLAVESRPGLLVAYVLLPAVLRVEQLRVPRWAAILIVYAVTLGTIAGFIALVVPSLVSEGRALSRELPKTVQHAQEEYLPIIDARLKQWSGSRAFHSHLEDLRCSTFLCGPRSERLSYCSAGA